MGRTIDMRCTEEDEVAEIRFADEYHRAGFNCQADILTKEGDIIRIKESGNGDYVRVWSADHARDLILALQKAIALGMLK